MRFANHDGRLTLVHVGAEDALRGARGIDVHEASNGSLPADPDAALRRWDEVLAWAEQAQSESSLSQGER